jgi:hypothetical protein
MFKKVYIAASVIGPALLFFGWPSNVSKLYGELAPQTYAAVVRFIPLGTAIDTAALRMKSQGFRCEARASSQYAGYNGTGALMPKVEYPASPILFCKATRWLPNLYQKSWVVILANDHSVVTNVAVSVDWDGF